MTETVLVLLMRVGVRTSGACLIVGLAWWLVDGTSWHASRLLTLGLMVLMATPMMRVAVSVVEAIRSRDWFYVWVTVAVAAILTITIARAAAH